MPITRGRPPHVLELAEQAAGYGQTQVANDAFRKAADVASTPADAQRAADKAYRLGYRTIAEYCLASGLRDARQSRVALEIAEQAVGFGQTQVANDAFRKAADLATSSQQARAAGESAMSKGYRTVAEYCFKRAAELAG